LEHARRAPPRKEAAKHRQQRAWRKANGTESAFRIKRENELAPPRWALAFGVRLENARYRQFRSAPLSDIVRFDFPPSLERAIGENAWRRPILKYANRIAYCK